MPGNRQEYETQVQRLKGDVLSEVARLAFADQLHTGILDIPEKLIPGPKATMRCCIYKERAIINERVKLAMGGDPENPNLVEVLPIACDECPVTEMTVSQSCRGCIAHRCVETCPKGAISIVNHRSVIDHDKCIVCGKCLTACPYHAIVKNTRPCEQACPTKAISMGEDKKASIDAGKCISCGNCVSTCPFGAIMDKSYITDAVTLLKGAKKWGYHVYAIVAPSVAGQFPPASTSQVLEGIRKLGFTDASEVARGADQTAARECRELAEEGSLFSSCCPAFVDYVEKFHSAQAEHISKTPSPMVMAAREIKMRDPRARVVFIGPCVAKKKEFQLGKTMGAVDCVLTFEELYALFRAEEIDLNELAGELGKNVSAYGRGFAVSGGVSKAVEKAMEVQGIDFPLKAVPCSGVAECNAALLKYRLGKLDGNFIEGMACMGGCVNGAGVLVRSAKNAAAVKADAAAALPGSESALAGED